jgi:hypothetical protein
MTTIACTLTPADLAARRSRWEWLVRAMTERAETSDGLRICFRPEPGTQEELRVLAAAENECCAWAEWTVEADDGQLALTAHATGEGVAALHAMFTGLPQSGP